MLDTLVIIIKSKYV